MTKTFQSSNSRRSSSSVATAVGEATFTAITCRARVAFVIQPRSIRGGRGGEGRGPSIQRQRSICVLGGPIRFQSSFRPTNARTGRSILTRARSPRALVLVPSSHVPPRARAHPLHNVRILRRLPWPRWRAGRRGGSGAYEGGRRNGSPGRRGVRQRQPAPQRGDANAKRWSHGHG